MINVITPASSRDLTTREMILKEWVGTEPDTDLVDIMITAASNTMAKWCRREFVQQEYEELLEAPERRKICLKEYPVLDTPVPVVESDGEAVTNFDVYSNTGILFKNDDTYWTGPTPTGGLLGSSVLASDRRPTIKVTYTAGWITRAIDPVTMDLPADIEDAAIYFTIQLIKSSKAKPIGDINSIKIGKFKVEAPEADSITGSGSGYWAEALGDPSVPWIPLRVRRVLMHYRKMI